MRVISSFIIVTVPKGQGYIVQGSRSHLPHCLPLLNLLKCQPETDIHAGTTPHLRFARVRVGLFSFDEEWMSGRELGQELWITALVFSVQTLGKV